MRSMAEMAGDEKGARRTDDEEADEPAQGGERSCSTFVPNGKKGGRPKDPVRADLRKFFPSWSDRTFARFRRALKLFDLAEVSSEARQRIIKMHTRPNGNLNVLGL